MQPSSELAGKMQPTKCFRSNAKLGHVKVVQVCLLHDSDMASSKMVRHKYYYMNKACVELESVSLG